MTESLTVPTATSFREIDVAMRGTVARHSIPGAYRGRPSPLDLRFVEEAQPWARTSPRN
jgi:hypothetical protein